MQPQQERWMFCVDFVFNPFSETQNSAGGAGGAGSGGGAGGSRESGWNQGSLDYFTLLSSFGNIGKLCEPGNNGKSFGNYQCLGDCICWIYLPVTETARIIMFLVGNP